MAGTERDADCVRLRAVIGDALEALGDGDYITSFDEDETFEKVVATVAQYIENSALLEPFKPYGEHPDVESGFICGSCGYPGKWLQEELVRVSEQLRAEVARLERAWDEVNALRLDEKNRADRLSALLGTTGQRSGSITTPRGR